MPKEILHAPFAKIERAIAQIDEFDAEIKAFFGKQPYELASEAALDGAMEVWRYRLTRKLPHAFNVRVGEILHNIRSPLDQMLSAIALQSHKSANGVAFPFGRDKAQFEVALSQQKKLPPDALQMIETLQPYTVGGNALLAALHYINKPDKHRPGLIPIIVRIIADLSTLVVSDGRVLTVGPRDGRHLARDADSNLSQNEPEKQPRLDPVPGRGHRIVFEVDGAAREQMEIATSIPGTVFQADFEPSFDVAFHNVGGVSGGQPIAMILRQMRQSVEGTLLAFEKRFFP